MGNFACLGVLAYHFGLESNQSYSIDKCSVSDSFLFDVQLFNYRVIGFQTMISITEYNQNISTNTI